MHSAYERATSLPEYRSWLWGGGECTRFELSLIPKEPSDSSGSLPLIRVTTSPMRFKKILKSDSSDVVFPFYVGLVNSMEVDDAKEVDSDTSNESMLRRWLRSIRTPIYLAHLAQSEGVEDAWRLFGKNEEDGTYFDIFRSFTSIQIGNIEASELC